MKTLALLLIIFSPYLYACGSDSETEQEVLTVSTFHEQLCETRVACGVYEELGDCMESYLYYSPIRTPYYRAMEPMVQILAKIELGTITFNSLNARRCLESFSENCQSQTDPDACEDILIGTTPLGDSCFINQECLGDAHCSRSAPASCELGICVESGGTVEANELCGEYNQDHVSCEEGLYCAFGGTIVDLHCTERQPIGAECPTGICEVGAYCDTRDNECKALPVTGEDCLAECQSLQDYCDPVSNTCQNRLPMGSACVETSDGTTDSRFSPCTLAGTCINDFCRPLPAENESCAQSRRCLTGWSCVGSMCIPWENPGLGVCP